MPGSGVTSSTNGLTEAVTSAVSFATLLRVPHPAPSRQSQTGRDVSAVHGSLGPTLGLSRALRAPVFAVLTAGLTAAGHVLAHGSPPSPGVLALVAGGCGVGRLLLGNAPRSFVRMGALMVGGQTIGHQLMSGDAPTHGVLQTVPASMTGHHHGGLILPSGGDEAAVSPAMLAAHALVALVLSWWLHRGESLADALARRLSRRLPHRPTPTLGVLWVAAAYREPLVLASRFTLAPAAGRAPPAFA